MLAKGELINKSVLFNKSTFDCVCSDCVAKNVPENNARLSFEVHSTDDTAPAGSVQFRPYQP